MTTGTLIDGIAASEAIDSSGEIFDVKGADITDFKEGRGLLNFEHKGGGDNKTDTGMDLVGKVIFAKKIYGPEDCTTERQKEYWKSIELPFVYIVGRLFDASGHENAKALAAIIRDCVDNKESIVLGFSIEGTTLKKEDNRLLSTICRRVAITAKPCNRSCNMGLLASSEAKANVSKVAVEKSEFINPDFHKLGGITQIEFSNPFLQEEDLEKTYTAGGYDAKPSSLTGGSATQVEDRGLRNRIKSAFRDWDRVTPLDKFLKHKLPEVSPDFIDKFTEMLDDYSAKAGIKTAFKKTLSNALMAKLMKTEDKPFRAAGFRNKETGQIIETGHHHDLLQMPDGEDTNLDHWDDGFVGHNGAFFTREQAAAAVHVDHPLHCEDEETGFDDVKKTFKDVRELLQGKEEEPEWKSTDDLVMKFEKMEFELKKALYQEQTEEEPVVFQNKHMIPGSGKTIGRRGQRFDILGHTPTHFMVVPEGRAHGFDHAELQKIPRSPDFHVERFPEELHASPILDANQHALPGTLRHPEAHALLQGFDLNQPRKYDNSDENKNGYQSFWAKGPNGKHVFVKEDNEETGEAKNEAVYHNLAKDFFGLGKYVPTVAAAFDPATGKHHAFIEHAEGNHLHGKHDTNSEEGKALLKLGDSGELHRLAVMNHVMQNGDRHQWNYLLGGPEGIKLIDHGLIFEPGHYDSSPHYLRAYQNMKTKTAQPHGDLDENTKQWILGLDANRLNQQLTEHGVAAPHVAESVRRLTAMQNYLRHPPQFEKAHGIDNLLMAHTGAIKPRG